jgi:hypothetical protein
MSTRLLSSLAQGLAGGFVDGQGGPAEVADAGEEEFFGDEGAGADDEGDEFAEDARFDKDAVAEHEDEPDGDKPHPGAQAGVGQPMAHHDDERQEEAAGAEHLRPGVG